MDLILSKGQGQAKWGHQMKMLHVMQHTVYGSFGMQNSDVRFIFRFGLRKGQVFFFFKQEHGSLIQFCLRIPNMSFILHIWQLEMQKNAFQKVASPMPFLPVHSQMQTYFFEILYACLYVALQQIFHFLDNSKNRFFGCLFLKNQTFEF